MAAEPDRSHLVGTNLELFGTDVEKKCKEEAANCEPQWTGVGQVPELRVWRIEYFKVVPWPQEEYGNFYDGDSYVILHAYGHPQSLRYDIFFWQGQDSTQDEKGTSAYKTVELDDKLGGAAVQHREVQGFESEEFMALWPGNMITILSGGVESGFTHVEPETYQPRLLHLKGKINAVRVTQVPLSRDSLNSGDVFILDLGLKLYQWNGKQSSGAERLKGGQLLRALNDERSGAPLVEIYSETDSDIPAEFWTPLGGAGPVKTAAQGGSDDAVTTQSEPKVFRLSDASGSLEFTPAGSGSLASSMLDSNDVFVVDSGKDVYAWVGKGASAAEKRNAIAYAQRYLTTSSKPQYIPISRVVEGRESFAFTKIFGSWTGTAPEKVYSIAGPSKTQEGSAPSAASNYTPPPAVQKTFEGQYFSGASGYFSTAALTNDNSWMKAGAVSEEAKKKTDKKRMKRDKKALKKQQKAEKKANKGQKKDKKDKKDKGKDKKDKKDKGKDKKKDKKDKKKDKKKKK